MAANDLATALSATTLDEDANPLRALPEGVLALSLERLHARDIASLRESAKDVITANDVPLLCRQIGGSRYDGVVRALARSKMTSPSKNRRTTTETRNDAGEALASLRVAELEKIADGCATATEPRDDDSVRGYWLSKNWAQHLRRYYEQSRAKLLSPSVKGTPQRRRSRSNSGEALPPWPDANAEILCEHGFLCPRACARPGSKRVLVSRETWRAIQGRFAVVYRPLTRLLAPPVSLKVAWRAISTPEELRPSAMIAEMGARHVGHLAGLCASKMAVQSWQQHAWPQSKRVARGSERQTTHSLSGPSSRVRIISSSRSVAWRRTPPERKPRATGRVETGGSFQIPTGRGRGGAGGGYEWGRVVPRGATRVGRPLHFLTVH